MSYSLEALQRSARLVRLWGSAPVGGGQTLAKALTIGGVSWWDAAAPNLAAFYLPPLLQPGYRPSLRQRVKPYISSIRNRARAMAAPPRGTAGCARWPAAPVCLFLGFSEYIHRDVLSPVMQRMAEAGPFRPVAMSGASALFDNPNAAAQREESWWHDVSEHWTTGTADEWASLRREFRRVCAEVITTARLREIVREGDHSLWPQTRSLFHWLFTSYFPQLLPHAAAASHVLRAHAPAVVVSADVDDARNRIFCLVARRAGIPTVEIQFGMFGSEAVEWQFFLADRLAVWGEHSRRVMMSHGVPAEKIDLTGSPRYDAPVRRAPGAAGVLQTRIGVPPGKRVVLFASVHAGLMDAARLAEVRGAIFRAIPASGELILVVKPHPAERADDMRRMAEGLAHIHFADPRDDIRQMIPECDAFVTLGSTATMDALLAGKLVIYPTLSDLAWWDDEFLKSGAVLAVRTEAELRECLQAVAQGESQSLAAPQAAARSRFLEDMVLRADGRATDRVVDVIVATANRPAQSQPLQTPGSRA